jgi:hypothetical protein
LARQLLAELERTIAVAGFEHVVLNTFFGKALAGMSVSRG